ncbi:MAG: hypothetical protein ACK47B_27175 [Armatimonadota bacterium]
MPAYLNPVSNREHSTFTWCGNCQRVAATREWDAHWWHCPACGAGAGTALPWEHLRRENPSYPSHPRVNARYRAGARPDRDSMPWTMRRRRRCFDA